MRSQSLIADDLDIDPYLGASSGVRCWNRREQGIRVAAEAFRG
jgi:hypothetical protein